MSLLAMGRGSGRGGSGSGGSGGGAASTLRGRKTRYHSITSRNNRSKPTFSSKCIVLAICSREAMFTASRPQCLLSRP
ncbi:hypothetical protein E2C01_026047 [Portunus trituberculatus]|uniref:Uncharacterized protein n=1 Tax=Portunus trituberculatus TaxID=210409 RepID=A0A5B7EEQ6_PORTR|nr:hypothetical protein [Portunus trituberculatus]